MPGLQDYLCCPVLYPCVMLWRAGGPCWLTCLLVCEHPCTPVATGPLSHPVPLGQPDPSGPSRRGSPSGTEEAERSLAADQTFLTFQISFQLKGLKSSLQTSERRGLAVSATRAPQGAVQWAPSRPHTVLEREQAASGTVRARVQGEADLDQADRPDVSPCCMKGLICSLSGPPLSRGGTLLAHVQATSVRWLPSRSPLRGTRSPGLGSMQLNSLASGRRSRPCLGWGPVGARAVAPIWRVLLPSTHPHPPEAWGQQGVRSEQGTV